MDKRMENANGRLYGSSIYFLYRYTHIPPPYISSKVCIVHTYLRIVQDGLKRLLLQCITTHTLIGKG